MGLLREFLAACVPAGRRVAFELTHASWDHDAVDTAIVDAGCTRCIADRTDGSARWPTLGTWAYVRPCRDDYNAAEMAACYERLPSALVVDAYVFFKHEDTAHGPAMAEALQALAG